MSESAANPSSLPEAAEPGLRGKPRLVLASFLMLFVELALIRWLGANIIYLSYFSNFVLLGSFLGIGVGFLRARASVNLSPWAPLALAILVLFVLVFPVQVDSSGNQLLFFGSYVKTGLPLWATLPVIFLAVAAIMAMIGEGVARSFVRFRPLEAYRLDIIGSIAGITVFSLLSFLGAKPVWWGTIAAAAFISLAWRRRLAYVGVLAAIALVGMLGVQSVSSSDIWSPYYRITVFPPVSGTYEVHVNGVAQQRILSTSQRQEFFSLPYKLDPGNPLNDVLIIGAGTGNDVAVALEHGARHVDAVEIDPQLQALGSRLHPNHPYQDPRVHVHINDGRAFLEQTDQRYDLILFALPDSLTLVSGQSSLRLESYLFTIQAIQAARDDLSPIGVFAMYNYYRQTWLLDRLANTAREAFGHAPCLNTAQNVLGMITIGGNASALRCDQSFTPTASVQPPATDDRPFVYLMGRSIPGFYIATLLLILLASILLIRVAGGPIRQMGGYLDLFFMGIAFLLLETKNVVQFALLFGTTWFVNALVFGGILLAVLAAVETSRRVRLRRPGLVYVALLASLAVAWMVPPRLLLELSFAPRFVVAAMIAFAPIYLANVIFSQRFRDVGDSTVAFAANLLGAMVGGVLEYTSLIFGYRMLLVLVAVLYGLAFLLGRKHLEGASQARPTVVRISALEDLDRRVVCRPKASANAGHGGRPGADRGDGAVRLSRVRLPKPPDLPTRGLAFLFATQLLLPGHSSEGGPHPFVEPLHDGRVAVRRGSAVGVDVPAGDARVRIAPVLPGASVVHRAAADDRGTRHVLVPQGGVLVPGCRHRRRPDLGLVGCGLHVRDDAGVLRHRGLAAGAPGRGLPMSSFHHLAAPSGVVPFGRPRLGSARSLVHNDRDLPRNDGTPFLRRGANHR